MTNEYVNIAIHFLDCILNNNGDITAEGISDLLEIHNRNKDVILAHLKAIESIISKAIEELEGENVPTSETKL